MTQRNVKLSFFFLLPLLVAFSKAASGQVINAVVLKNVKGPVTVVDRGGASAEAKDGQRVAEGFTVMTGEEGSVVLLFSTGSTVTVTGNTKMSIAQFFQETHGDASSLMELKTEPSRSTTRLKVDYGEIVGRTKKLRPESTYMIDTPIGVAGIRGTIYSITVVLDPITREFSELTIAVVEGLIEFDGSVTTLISSVPADNQITIKLSKDPDTGLPKYDAFPADLDPAKRAEIMAIVAITNALLGEVFASGEIKLSGLSSGLRIYEISLFGDVPVEDIVLNRVLEVTFGPPAGLGQAGGTPDIAPPTTTPAPQIPPASP